MKTVIGVKFRDNGKIYYYDPGDEIFKINDYVFVDTLMGLEFAIVIVSNKEIDEKCLKSDLKKIRGRASINDRKIADENILSAKKAFVICKEKISDYKLPMTLIEARYLFDKSKLIFSFTSDERVDFRDFVKDLGSVFKTRIELRQISVRDQLSQMTGCCGVCGRELCCQKFIKDFDTVSVKMIKEQNLSFNTSKMTGSCGKLMCCLRYEQNVYEDKADKLPKTGAKVFSKTDGNGVVDSVEYLKEVIRVKFVDNENNSYYKKVKASELEY